MKILFLTSRLPWPPDRGDRLRTFHFLREMSADHDVTLLSLIQSSAEVAGVARLEELGATVGTVTLSRGRSLANMAFAAPSTRPFQVAYYRSAEMARRVADLARDRDVVLAHLVRTAPYLDAVPRGVVRVVDLCDCISSEYLASLPHRRGLERMFYREEARRIAKYEREVVGTVDEAWVISSVEAEKLGSAGNIAVVPNGVCLPRGEAPAKTGAQPRLVFTGNFSVPHNVDAARFLVAEILPLVVRTVPDVHLALVGAEPVDAVRSLAGPAVEVTGWVDDLEAVLRRSDVFVAPMRFVAGVQNKALEAMSGGLPVVTTEAVRLGIGADDGTHLLVGRDAGEIAGAVVRLLRDPDLAGRLGGAGQAFVREHFSWSAVLDRLDALGSRGAP